MTDEIKKRKCECKGECFCEIIDHCIKSSQSQMDMMKEKSKNSLLDIIMKKKGSE
jgi:hypothetical protein